jgi:hypothetical protein
LDRCGREPAPLAEKGQVGDLSYSECKETASCGRGSVEQPLLD